MWWSWSGSDKQAPATYRAAVQEVQASIQSSLVEKNENTIADCRGTFQILSAFFNYYRFHHILDINNYINVSLT